MKDFVKKCFYRVAPQQATEFFSARARAHSHRVLKTWKADEVALLLKREIGNAVIDGPFKGTELPEHAWSEQVGPYLLGVYEAELDAMWERVFRRQYAQVVDVGAKFGFYAVGLARHFPKAAVVAFDTDVWARQAITEMAAVNNVANVLVKSYCNSNWLASNLTENALIVSDCEGFEVHLFLYQPINHLRSATIIIETHDHIKPGTLNKLKQHFSKTHDLVEINSTDNRRQPTVDLGFLTPKQKSLATFEVRSDQTWLCCFPTAHS
jgi:precorrin-6B methylase 2